MKTPAIILASIVAGFHFGNIHTDQIHLTGPGGETCATVETYGDGSKGFVVSDSQGRRRLGVYFPSNGPTQWEILGPGSPCAGFGGLTPSKPAPEAAAASTGGSLLSISSTGKAHFENCRYFKEETAKITGLGSIGAKDQCKICWD